MPATENGPDISPRGPIESPGRALAIARESQSISPADLAIRLRLDTKIIMALERDDFENLPAPTFIKGYIRSIAKELNIDSHAILESYATQAALEPPPLADFSSRAPEQIGTNSTIIKSISYGLAATLILLIALWWQTNYQNREAPPPDAIVDHELQPEPEARPGPLPLYSYDIVEDTSNLPQLVESHALLISTTDEAWVEVYDHAGNKLYFGLTRKGQLIEIDSEVYYRLTLGNADSISLQYRGDDIDLSLHSTNGVAQLELGTVVVEEEQ
jgi:cytoskeleton protein RodZ